MFNGDFRMERYLIGLDVGTSGTKAILIDEAGALKSSSTVEYPLYTPQPLWAEQPPSDWWNATCMAVRSLLEQSGIPPSAVVGIGLSGQMHGSVFLDESHQVIRPALLWCDQRTAAECDWITETVGRERVLEWTLNPVLTGFTAGKIVWLHNHEPGHYARVRKVLLPKDYIRFLLTGEFATEVSDASGTALFNVRKRDWAYEMLDALNLPLEWFPRVYESPEVTGRISEWAAGQTGLAAGTPVVGGGGDQAAGAVGNGIVESGIVSSSLGTSGVVFAFLDEPVVDSEYRTHTFCHAVPGKWHVMGVMLMAGGSLRWYRDTLAEPEKQAAQAQGTDPYDLIIQHAMQVPPGSEGLIFLPYLSGERTPYPDPYARGVFFGLTLSHTRAHLARAVLEGVSFGIRDSFEILQAMGVKVREVRVSGGGARSAPWRQMMADVTGYPHVTLNMEEGPAFGAALLAGVGTGVWASVPAACHATLQVSSRTEPDPALTPRYEQSYQIYRALYPAVRELYPRCV
jgi:xylulokinase